MRQRGWKSIAKETLTNSSQNSNRIWNLPSFFLPLAYTPAFFSTSKRNPFRNHGILSCSDLTQPSTVRTIEWKQDDDDHADITWVGPTFSNKSPSISYIILIIVFGVFFIHLRVGIFFSNIYLDVVGCCYIICVLVLCSVVLGMSFFDGGIDQMSGFFFFPALLLQSSFWVFALEGGKSSGGPHIQ